ncbi:MULTISPECIES: ComEC/Rec2 family competence protein [Hyphobacterium]|uniref:ComEC/Rec2 family competence protein n=1 Tax=Hyphobacterium vulgare TaxID=1736751 RepID=A0ABV6ZSY4_9PROT
MLARLGWGDLPLSIALPAAFGVGAVVYYALPSEPHPWMWLPLSVAATMCAGLAFASARRQRYWPIALLIAAMSLAGFARSDLRTAGVAHTVIADSDRARVVTGWIEQVQRSTSRERLIIRVDAIEGIDIPPPRVRVTASRGEFVPGDAIRLRAVLGPPPRPAVPGSYDSGFAAWFSGIGGTGFAVSRPEAAEVSGHGFARGFAAWRWSIAERIRARMPERTGGVAAALLTGDRSGIDPDVAESLRASGLGHILAISGLHMALMAGGVFFAATWVIARIEPLARAIDPRKPAAIAALLAACAYLLLSGAAIPTQRAFVMTGAVLLGVLAGRRAASMHMVGIAALAVLVFQPESVVTPGFQMSFAAAIALVAAFNLARRRPAGPRGLLSRFAGFWGALAGSSLVAGSATGGFAAFHFHRLAAYGFGANLAAMPVFSLLVMPAGAIALLLMPLGLDAPALWAMDKGLSWVIAVASFTESLPGSLTPAAAAPGLALAIYGAGFVFLAAGRGLIRLAGAAGMGLALIIWAFADQPDALITEGGVMIARFGEAETWSASNTRRSRFAAHVFLERSGEERGQSPASGVICDYSGCMGRASGRVIAFPDSPEFLSDDCRHADLVVTRFPVRGTDRSACQARLIDARQLNESGALALWFGPDGRLGTQSVDAVRGERPWTARGDQL